MPPRCMYALLYGLTPEGVWPTEWAWSELLGTFIPTEAMYCVSGLEEEEEEEEVEMEEVGILGGRLLSNEEVVIV